MATDWKIAIPLIRAKIKMLGGQVLLEERGIRKGVNALLPNMDAAKELERYVLDEVKWSIGGIFAGSAEDPQCVTFLDEYKDRAIWGLGVSLSLTNIGKDEYECTTPGFDYHIRKEKRKWMVDGFNSLVAHPDEAHIGSEEVNNFQEAIDFIIESGFR